MTTTHTDRLAGSATAGPATDLSAIEGLTTTGMLVRTGTNSWALRSLAGPAAGLSIADGDGVAGAPTLALANDLAALEGLGSTGIAVRAAADSWVQRSVAAGTGISVTNGDGVSGNPSVAIDTAVVARLGVENQALAGGAAVTVKDLGTQSSGTLTLDMGDRPLQKCVNGGAFTLAPGSVKGCCLLTITNNGSAGAITVSSWTKVAGDDFATADGDKFLCHCTVDDDGDSVLAVQAMQ